MWRWRRSTCRRSNSRFRAACWEFCANTPDQALNEKSGPASCRAALFSPENRLPDPSRGGQPLGGPLVDRLLRDIADDLLRYLAALEEQQRGNAADAVASRSGRIAIHIHLHDLEF